MAVWLPLFSSTAASSLAASWSVMSAPGPGGNILGLSFATDGAAISRTDTGGCYVRVAGGTVWVRLLPTFTSMPAGTATIMGDFFTGGVFYGGTYAAVPAPSNSSVIYIYQPEGHLYVSTNQGVTFTTCAGFTAVAVAVNGAVDSGWDHRIAVDPQDPARLFVSNPNGVFYSSDSGATFGAALSTGAGTYGSLIAFDPNSGVSGGKKQGVYVSTYDGANAGIWHSIDGGSSWSQVGAGMPTLGKKLIVSGDGTAYVVSNNATNNVYRFSAGAWSTLAPFNASLGGQTIQDIAIDPANSSRVLAIGGNGCWSDSTDHGATWTGNAVPLSGSINRISPAIPWLATTPHPLLALSACKFNPAGSNELWVVDGISPWKTTPVSALDGSTSHSIGTGNPITFTVQTGLTINAGDNIIAYAAGSLVNFMNGTVNSYNSGSGALSTNMGNSGGSGTFTSWTIQTAVNYTSFGVGINQLIGQRIVIPPGGAVMNYTQDRCSFYISSPTTFPSSTSFPSGVGGNEICIGYDGDYSATNTSYQAGIYNSNISSYDTSGFSADGGQSWTVFGSNSPWNSNTFIGGAMAVAATASVNSSQQNIVWMPAGSGTGNRPSYSVTGGSSWNFCTFPSSVPTSGNTGWPTGVNVNTRPLCADRVALNTFYDYNTVTQGVYKSTDGGASWIKVNTTTPPNTNGIQYMKPVDKLGSTNTSGWVFAWNQADNQNDVFIRTKDGGVTWSPVTASGTFTGVAYMGIGATVNGAVPAILVVGIKGGARGIFLSVDDCVTWTNVTGNFSAADQIRDVEGDKSATGVWYICTQSTGIYRGTNIA